MKKWRLKTNIEHEKEYGFLWRENLKNGWSLSMEFYLGMELPEEFTRDCNKGGEIYFEDYYWDFRSYKLIEPKFHNGVKKIKNGLLDGKV